MILLDSLHGFLRPIKSRHVPPISLSFTVESNNFVALTTLLHEALSYPFIWTLVNGIAHGIHIKLSYRYWLNHTTAWQKACSLVNLLCLLLRSARTAKPCDTPLNRLICHGWPVLIRVPSDSWRSWVVKIWSTSGDCQRLSATVLSQISLPAAAIDSGPVMAPSSSCVTKDGCAV
jgi:hypothetical protein